MKPDLDSMIAEARARQDASKILNDDFNQHVWRRIHMSGDMQRRLALLLASRACGLWCLLLAIGIGAGFGWSEAKRQPSIRTALHDLSVFGAEPPSLPSSLLHQP